MKKIIEYDGETFKWVGHFGSGHYFESKNHFLFTGRENKFDFKLLKKHDLSTKNEN